MTAGPQQYYSQAHSGMPPGAQPAPTASRRGRLVVAAVLAGLAAALTVASMFVAYNSYVATKNGEVNFAQESGPWGASYTLAEGREAPAGTVPLYGIALALLVVALLVGLVLAVRASSRRVAPAKLGAARAAATVYGTAALSIETMVSLTVLAFLSHEEPAQPGDSWSYHYNLEVGYWLLLGMAVLAAVAMVLTLVPESDAPAGARFDPRYGAMQQQAPQQYPYYGQPGYGTQQAPPSTGPWAR